MDDCKAFRDRDISSICDYLTLYCESHINAKANPSIERVSAFYTFLPTLLTYIFGSPTSRGWMQTETRPNQDTAIRHMLRPSGAFFLALVKLSKYQEYSYNITTESLPEDVRNALAAGATQFLPNVYKRYTVYETPATKKALNIRASATHQSTIYPRFNVGEHHIKFNMLQFYLFYAVSAPSWTYSTPAVSSTAKAPIIASTAMNVLDLPGAKSTGSNTHNNALFSAQRAAIQNNTRNDIYSSNYTSIHGDMSNVTNNKHRSDSTPSTSTIAATITSNNNSVLSNQPIHQTSPFTQSFGSKSSGSLLIPSGTLPYQIPGWYRTIVSGVFGGIIQDYMYHFIPAGRQRFHPDIDTFFLDCCVELWLRTAWIPSSDRLSSELIFVIQMFIKHVVNGDLRWAITSANNPQRADFGRVYIAVKDELYALLSRLAINWIKNDSFLNVLELWSLWAAPWRLGNAAQSYNTITHRPIEEGWGAVVLDNALFYLSLVEIILERTAGFTYQSGSAPTSIYQSYNVTLPIHQSSSAPMSMPIVTKDVQTTDASIVINTAQLRTVQKFLNVMQTDGLVDFLGNVERGLAMMRIDVGPSNRFFQRDILSSDALDALAIAHCGSRTGVHAVQTLLENLHDQLVQLGDDSSWRPRNIYTHKRHPRAKCLTDTLNALYNIIETKKKKPLLMTGPSVPIQTQESTWQNTPFIENAKKSSDQLTEVSILAESLASVFKLREMEIQTNQSSIAAVAAAAMSLANSALKLADKSPKTASTRTERMAGLGLNGYLTSEEKLQVKQGKIRCSIESIPAVGPRAEEIVRSYEIAELVALIVRFDRWLNWHYQQWFSPQTTPYLPARLTIRPLAAGINLAYIFLLVFLLNLLLFGVNFACLVLCCNMFILFSLKYSIH